jgi:transcriptional regulator of arginine metabolism
MRSQAHSNGSRRAARRAPGAATGHGGRVRRATDARRDAIREILLRLSVSTQDDLQRHLAARGIEVAQATVSRDLVQLGVTRVGTAGGPRYLIPEADDMLPLDPVRRFADSVHTNGVLVVVRTKAGAASTVARAIDDARLPEVLGTLAGDDTVFVAPARSRGAPAVARRLRRLLG